MLAPDQTPIESSISKQPSEDAAEVLVWMGTAYGRRKTAEQKPALVTAATDLRARAAALNHALAALNLPTFAGPARKVMAGAALAFVAALSATWVTGQFDNGTAMDTAGLATFAPAEPVHEAAVAAEPKAPELMPAALPDDRVDRDKLERAARDAADAKSQLASEREARLSAEEKAARLEIATAAERQARQAAETSSAALGSELAAERKARAEAEDAVRLAKAAAAEKSAAAMPVTAAASGPAVAAKPAEAKPAEVAPRPEPVLRTNGGKPDPSAANTEFREGQKEMGKGNLAAARQHFERAALSGSAEAALAAGNTFDPVSLTKAGLKQAGDPMRAREWYRRAYELAQIRQ